MVPSSSQANQAKSAFVAPAVAGLVSGWIGVVIGHPLDTMKTRIQTNRPLLVLSLSELYRGIAPPLLTVGFVQAANFSLLEGGKTHLQKELGMSFLPSVFCSALGSGMVLSVFTAPFSFCKVQQQVSSNKSLLRCAGDAYGLGGIRTFYRGYPTLLCCEALGRAVYMGTYESCRFVDKTSLPVQIASAAWAGVFSWTVIYPLDVIKNRVQLDSRRERYINALDCARKTYAEGGLPIFFRGLSMTVLRAAPVAAAILTSYEYIKAAITEMAQSQG